MGPGGDQFARQCRANARSASGDDHFSPAKCLIAGLHRNSPHYCAPRMPIRAPGCRHPTLCRPKRLMPDLVPVGPPLSEAGRSYVHGPTPLRRRCLLHGDAWTTYESSSLMKIHLPAARRSSVALIACTTASAVVLMFSGTADAAIVPTVGLGTAAQYSVLGRLDDHQHRTERPPPQSRPLGGNVRDRIRPARWPGNRARNPEHHERRCADRQVGPHCGVHQRGGPPDQRHHSG